MNGQMERLDQMKGGLPVDGMGEMGRSDGEGYGCAKAGMI